MAFKGRQSLFPAYFTSLIFCQPTIALSYSCHMLILVNLFLFRFHAAPAQCLSGPHYELGDVGCFVLFTVLFLPGIPPPIALCLVNTSLSPKTLIEVTSFMRNFQLSNPFLIPLPCHRIDCWLLLSLKSGINS